MYLGDEGQTPSPFSSAPGVVSSISGGDQGIYETINRMIGLVHEAMRDRRVKHWAAKMVMGLRVADKAGQVEAIKSFVQSRFNFIADTAGVEELVSPILMLRDLEDRNYLIGDCDDLSMLLAALVRAVGIPARFQVSGFKPDSKGIVQYTHVGCQAFIKGVYISMDFLPAGSRIPSRTAAWEI